MPVDDANIRDRGQSFSLPHVTPPRAVALKTDRKDGFWYLVVFVVPLGLFGLWLVVKLAMNIDVLRHGSTLTAIVDRTSTYKSRGSDRYEVDYHYQLNGQRFTDTEPVDYDTYLALDKDSEIEIRAKVFGGYAVSMVASNAARDVGGLAFGTTAVNAFTALFVIGLWVVPRRRRQLLVWGNIAQGVITERRRTGGKKASSFIHYQFTPLGARQPISRQQVVRRPDYDGSAVNQPITVFYDPERPTRSIAYEFCDYRLEGGRS